MIFDELAKCPDCGGELKHYDCVKRILRTKKRNTTYILISRVRCSQCKRLHRILSDNIIPYKQYEAELIIGVKEGLINSNTLGYENYPCETTMKRWLSE